MRMAGNEYAETARERKVAAFVAAAQQVITGGDHPEDRLWLLDHLIKHLSGEKGQQGAIEYWGLLRTISNEGPKARNHGVASHQTQTLVLGTLVRQLGTERYYAEQPVEQVFAGLSAVK
jgi:hypothetical protein